MKPETEFTDLFLTDIEKDILKTVADNALLTNALKKVILADVYFKGTLRVDINPDPTRNAAIAFAFSQQTKTDAELGQDIRAFAEGVRLVESGFSRLEKFKSAPIPGKTTGNKAR